MCHKGEDEIEECCTDQFSQNAEKTLETWHSQQVEG